MFGADERNRTSNILITEQALYLIEPRQRLIIAGVSDGIRTRVR